MPMVLSGLEWRSTEDLLESLLRLAAVEDRTSMGVEAIRSPVIRRIPTGIMAPERPKNIIGLSGSFSILSQILYDWPSFRLWNEVALNASSASLTDRTFATS